MNRELAGHMAMLMVNSNSCAATMTQWAGVEALEGPQDSVTEMVAAFRERRDYLVKAMNEIEGVRCLEPKGAFYAFPNVASLGLSSAEFADRLLDEAGVAALAGSAFGACGEGYLRLSCANSMENLKIAAERIAVFARGLRR
jgi:aspartate/methionine/tyrosine aminotransferase